MREVGIIIPAYRREKELFQLLKSLNKLNYSKKKTHNLHCYRRF